MPKTDLRTTLFLSVGDYVKLRLPPYRKDKYQTLGVVDAIEVYIDAHGARVWYLVLWVDGEGKPDRDSNKYAADQLELDDGQ